MFMCSTVIPGVLYNVNIILLLFTGKLLGDATLFFGSVIRLPL